jgi:hypothetical protein
MPKARHSGQILSESHRVTSTEPGGPPPRSTATTLTDLELGNTDHVMDDEIAAKVRVTAL